MDMVISPGNLRLDVMKLIRLTFPSRLPSVKMPFAASPTSLRASLTNFPAELAALPVCREFECLIKIPNIMYTSKLACGGGGWITERVECDGRSG